MLDTPVLPADADGVLKLAAQSMLDVFAQTALGMVVVDRKHRIVWISEGYWPTGPFAPTSTTGSTCCRSGCRA